MIIPSVEPIAFNLFGVPVYWYGIIMASAILVAVLIANYLLNKTETSTKDIIINSSTFFILFGILGARLYYCLLNLPYYINHPMQVLDIRQGGLSIHGAILFGVLALFFVAKHYKIAFLKLLDVVACSTILAQSIGRWGNYFNSEAYGLPTSSQTWGLFIPQVKRVAEFVQYSFFHPTFLYESILDFISFFVLLFIYKKFSKTKLGVTFFSYLIIYSIIRFFI